MNISSIFQSCFEEVDVENREKQVLQLPYSKEEFDAALSLLRTKVVSLENF